AQGRNQLNRDLPRFGPRGLAPFAHRRKIPHRATIALRYFVERQTIDGEAIYDWRVHRIGDAEFSEQEVAAGVVLSSAFVPDRSDTRDVGAGPVGYGTMRVRFV